jgi:hypothetical protein
VYADLPAALVPAEISDLGAIVAMNTIGCAGAH